MKILASTLSVALLVSTFASANCTDPQVGGNLTDLISGSLICGRPGAAYPGAATDRWQEQHRAGGLIFDYKRGVGNPIDPESQVGTYTTTNGSNATYTATYDALSYPYQLRLISGNTYSFCIGAAEHVRGNIIANGGVSGGNCGGVFPP
jgi:hypothetical protein